MSSTFTRAVIIHGWDGHPGEGWFPWVKTELEAMGIHTQVLDMPHPQQPEIDSWVEKVSLAVGVPGTHLLLIGHSIGCQTILRYLERLSADQQVGGVVLVAGWFHLSGLETDTERAIAQPWLVTPIDFDKVRDRTLHISCILSDNDPFVPLAENRREFEHKLGAKVYVLSGKGHINGETGITELPLVKDIVTELQQTQ